MINTIKTKLYQSPAPLEWATVGNGILFTAQIPIDKNGQVVKGGIETQVRQTLDNLQHTLECAGSDYSCLTQVMIYVTDRSYLPIFNKIYAEYVSKPYPNRAALVVAGLAREEMLVEVVAYGTIEMTN